MRVEPRVAVAQHLDRHRVDPRRTGELAVVALRQVAPDLAHLAFHEMEVVEQPLGRGGDRFAAACVTGERAVGLAQHLLVVGQAPQQTERAALRIAGKREARGQRAGALFEPGGAGQLAV
jgi:hypothetical protein